MIAPEQGGRRLPPNEAAGRARPGRARAVGWIAAAVLLAAACDPDAPEAITREAFIETYVALRVAELTDQGDGMISAEARERVLDEQGVTEEELFGFVGVHGGDVDFMKALWEEVEERMKALRDPPDTTEVGEGAGGPPAPHSHLIVAGGFELMS